VLVFSWTLPPQLNVLDKPLVRDVVYVAVNPSKRPEAPDTNFTETLLVLEVNGHGFAAQYLFL
jgi:hypothetical protein